MAASCPQPCAVRVVPRAARTGRGPEVVVMPPFHRSGRPGGIGWSELESGIRDSGESMPGNAPAATRALEALRVLAAAPGPDHGGGSRSPAGHPPLVHVPPAGGDGGRRLRHPLSRGGAVGPGRGCLRDRSGLPASRAARATGPAAPAPARARRRGPRRGRGPPGRAARARDPVPAARVPADPGHRGRRRRSATARRPDRQRAGDAGRAAGGPGARAVPVQGRLRRPDGCSAPPP